jgi:hypothetical protein
MTKQNSIKKFTNNGMMPLAKLASAILVTTIVTGCAASVKANGVKIQPVDTSKSPAKSNCIGMKLEKCLKRFDRPYTRKEEGNKVTITVKGDKWLKRGPAIGLYGKDLPMSIPTEKEKMVFIAVDGIVRHSYQTVQHGSGSGFYIMNVGHGSPIWAGSGEGCEEWGSKKGKSCYSYNYEGNDFYQIRNLAVGSPISEFTAQKPIKVADIGKSNKGYRLEYCYQHIISDDNWYFTVNRDTGVIQEVKYWHDCYDVRSKRFSNIRPVEHYRRALH